MDKFSVNDESMSVFLLDIYKFWQFKFHSFIEEESFPVDLCENVASINTSLSLCLHKSKGELLELTQITLKVKNVKFQTFCHSIRSLVSVKFESVFEPAFKCSKEEGFHKQMLFYHFSYFAGDLLEN